MTVTSSPFKIKITSVDDEPPTVNISTPSLGAVVVIPPGQPLVVSGTASDLKSGVDYVEALVDTGGYQRATGTTGWVISFSGVPPGIHTVRARSRDKAGNYSAEKVTSFTVQAIILPPPPPPPPPPPTGPPPPPPPTSGPWKVKILRVDQTYYADSNGSQIASGTDMQVVYQKAQSTGLTPGRTSMETIRLEGDLWHNKKLLMAPYVEIDFAGKLHLLPNSNVTQIEPNNHCMLSSKQVPKSMLCGLDGNRAQQGPSEFANKSGIQGNNITDFGMVNIDIANPASRGMYIRNGMNIYGRDCTLREIGTMGIACDYTNALVDSHHGYFENNDIWNTGEQNYEFGMTDLHIKGGILGDAGLKTNPGHITIEPQSIIGQPLTDVRTLIEDIVCRGAGQVSAHLAPKVVFKHVDIADTKDGAALEPYIAGRGLRLSSCAGASIIGKVVGGVMQPSKFRNIRRTAIMVTESSNVIIEDFEIDGFGKGGASSDPRADKPASAGVHISRGTNTTILRRGKINGGAGSVGYGVYREPGSSATIDPSVVITNINAPYTAVG